MNGEQRYKKVYKVTGLSVIKQHTKCTGRIQDGTISALQNMGSGRNT